MQGSVDPRGRFLRWVRVGFRVGGGKGEGRGRDRFVQTRAYGDECEAVVPCEGVARGGTAR
jgi:hypothetical protein